MLGVIKIGVRFKLKDRTVISNAFVHKTRVFGEMSHQQHDKKYFWKQNQVY